MAITLQRPVCPPSTQYAVYNNITSRKNAIVYGDFGHEHLPGFADAAFGFLTFRDAGYPRALCGGRGLPLEIAAADW